MTWFEILIQYLIPAITIIISFIISIVKNKKVKKFASNLLNITHASKEFIIEAEKHKNYTGEEKKNFVMSRLFKFIVDNAISNVSENTLSDIVEKEVDLTNNVNVEKKTKTILKNSSNNVKNSTEDPQTLNV